MANEGLYINDIKIGFRSITEENQKLLDEIYLIVANKGCMQDITDKIIVYGTGTFWCDYANYLQIFHRGIDYFNNYVTLTMAFFRVITITEE